MASVTVPIALPAGTHELELELVSGYSLDLEEVALASSLSVTAPEDGGNAAFPVLAVGTADPGTVVSIFNDETGALLGTATATAQGSWSLLLPFA